MESKNNKNRTLMLTSNLRTQVLAEKAKVSLDPATSCAFRLGESFVLALARCLSFALTLTFFALVFAWPVRDGLPCLPPGAGRYCSANNRA